MSDEDIDIDEAELVDDPELDKLSEQGLLKASSSCDSRRRLEEKLEEARLRKQLQDYDFD